jgi:sugar phosphate permease
MQEQVRLRRQRWAIFFVLALVYILVYFYRVSLAVVARDVSEELHLTPAQLGSLSSILFYVYAAAQIPLGPMIDRLGSRLVITGCGLLTAFGGILFSQAGSLGEAMAARALLGLGTAPVLMATFTIFSHWFTKQEFGRVSGFMVAVGNLGNLGGTAPLALAVTLVGWRHSFLAVRRCSWCWFSGWCATARPRALWLRARQAPSLPSACSTHGRRSSATATSGSWPPWHFAGTATTLRCRGFGAGRT